MTDDRYDDGLVHGHAWATEPPAHAAGSQPRNAQSAAAMPARVQEAESFDEGLVHPHGWASAERGRMAERQ